MSKKSTILDGETDFLHYLIENIEYTIHKIHKDIVKFKNTPISSVNVKMSFSIDKNILSDRRMFF